jgi:hypothetical protein
MVTIPLSFAMFIILSIAFNRMPALKAYTPTLADKTNHNSPVPSPA